MSNSIEPKPMSAATKLRAAATTVMAAQTMAREAAEARFQVHRTLEIALAALPDPLCQFDQLESDGAPVHCPAKPSRSHPAAPEAARIRHVRLPAGDHYRWERDAMRG